MERMNCNIIWFKRDLRLTDHGPLAQAIKDGHPVLLCYFFEPSVVNLPETDERHLRFIYQSLQELEARLRPFTLQLYIFYREVAPIFQALSKRWKIHAIYSHQETGLRVTFERDKWVKKWCQQNNISFKEFPQDGVMRGKRSREHWKDLYNQFLSAPQHQVALEELKGVYVEKEWYAQNRGLELPADVKKRKSDFQPGGSAYAWKYLTTFVHNRSKHYGYQLAKPEGSRYSCSRLSPYLAFGNISIREVFQYMSYYANSVGHTDMLNAFQDRLWWRSHYIQKLETEPALEERAMNPGLRDLGKQYRPDFFEAWVQGKTGFPMVDACMRCLAKTGFLNFRMRAMLATFWSFSLWQPWKPGAVYLAKVFLDFEPGIHYAQWQMQAGLTGYHPLRIFNPIIQFKQHDSKAVFVKKWVPELAKVPVPQIFEPQKMTYLEQQFFGCIIGTDYPAPIIQYDQATSEHRDMYWSKRKAPETQLSLPDIWIRHCLPENIEMYREMVSTSER